MLRGFYQGAGTAGTNLHALSLSLVKHGLFLDVGLPLSIGSLFGVTHVVTKLRPFTADLTFRHRNTSRLLLMIITGEMIPQKDGFCNP
jgi:hypothetical protein